MPGTCSRSDSCALQILSVQVYILHRPMLVTGRLFLYFLGYFEVGPVWFIFHHEGSSIRQSDIILGTFRLEFVHAKVAIKSSCPGV